jgi:hypothetical protein
MSPHTLYERQASLAWTRIDLLLALFDAAIERGEQALAAGDEAEARRLRARARLAILALWAGVDREGPSAGNFIRLYEFADHAFTEGGPEQMRGALSALRTLREGFVGIRAEAAELERCGAIPPADATCAVHALA